MKKIISLIFLLFLSVLHAEEKKFLHAAGEYDFDGLALLKGAFSNQQIQKELDDFIKESARCRFARHSAYNCTIKNLASYNYDKFSPYYYNKYKNINSLYNRMQESQGTIDWKPYLTGNFVHNEETLFHKLADLCDQDKDNELLVLLKTIDELSGPNYTIESSYHNAFGNNNETGQPVCFDLVGGGQNGFGMSVLFKNKNGQTPLDITEKKLKNGYLFKDSMLRSSCIPCKELNKTFQKLHQNQTIFQNYLDSILKEEKNVSSIPVQMLNDDAFEAYKQYATDYGLSPEQQSKVIEQQQTFCNSCKVSSKNLHDRRFPILMMKNILQRNNLDINNFNLIVFNDGMADNGGVLYNQYAVSFISHSNTTDHTIVKLNVGVYPQFFTLSSAEQKAVLIQQIEHLNLQKIYPMRFLLRAISHKNEMPISQITSSESFKKYQQALEKLALNNTAGQNKEVATLFNNICSSSQNRIFSKEQCDFLKKIASK